MASSPKTTTETKNIEPWSGAKPYLTDVYANYDAALKAGQPKTWDGPTVAETSANTKLGQQMASSTALSGQNAAMFDNATKATNGIIQNGGQNASANDTYNRLMSGVNLGQNPATSGLNNLINNVQNQQSPGTSVYSNLANTQNPGLAASQDALAKANSADPSMANLAGIASGASVGNNPYLEQSLRNNQQGIADMLAKTTLPGLQSKAAMLGRNGSGAFASQVNDASTTAANAMSKMATDMYAGQYNTDMQQMMGANQQLSSAHNAGVANSQNAANGLGSAYAQNASTQMAGANALGADMQQRTSNLSNLLGQQNDQFNQGVSNSLNNANLSLNAANGGQAASQAGANLQLNAAGQAGNIYNNQLLPAETIGQIGANQDSRAQEVLNGQIATWDTNQQMPLIQQANFANILNGGNFSTQTSQTTQPGNSLLSNLLGIGAAGLGLYSKCDITVKEAIEYIGQSPNGWGMYKFKYIGDDNVYVGPIAQEIELTHPDLVVSFGGTKHVNNIVFEDLRNL